MGQNVLLKIQSILSSIKKSDIVISRSSNQKIVEEYDLDSLAFMQFITALENEFNFEFANDATYEELNDLDYILREIKKHAAFDII